MDAITNSPMNPFELAQKVSQQDDRYLFIVVILLLGMGMLYGIRMVAKYFISQHESLMAEARKDRSESQLIIQRISENRIDSLKQFNLEREKEHAEFVRCVDASTSCIARNTAILEEMARAVIACPASEILIKSEKKN